MDITMKRITKSLFVITALALLTVGATVAIFSSTATLNDNTFATGTLEIRINGSSSAPGFNVANAAPGTSTEKVFSLQNYGAPWFAGPSTLPAKELAVSTPQDGGDSGLYDALVADLYVNAGWGGCSNLGVTFVPGKGCRAYHGALAGLDGGASTDLLHYTQWGAHPDLVPGNSFTMTLDVELPTGADNSLMGKSTTFDLVVDGYNPHR
jgi:predicted ribosomally synthesized peptide with SipW-like signal peptide